MRAHLAAAIAASKSRRGLVAAAPITTSLWNQATTGHDLVVFDSGRSVNAPATFSTGVPSTCIASGGRGSGAGIRQFEIQVFGSDFASLSVGLCKAGWENLGAGHTAADPDDGWVLYGPNGNGYHQGAGIGLTSVSAFADGDVLGFILDTALYKIYVYKNTSTPTLCFDSAVNADLAGTYYPCFSMPAASTAADPTGVLNTGQEAFRRAFSGATPWG